MVWDVFLSWVLNSFLQGNLVLPSFYSSCYFPQGLWEAFTRNIMHCTEIISEKHQYLGISCMPTFQGFKINCHCQKAEMLHPPYGPP